MPTDKDHFEIRDGHAITVNSAGAVARMLTSAGAGVLNVSSGADLAADTIVLNKTSSANIAGAVDASWKFEAADVSLSGALSAHSMQVAKMHVSGDATLKFNSGKVSAMTIADSATLTKQGTGLLKIQDSPGARFVASEGTIQARIGADLTGATMVMDGGKVSLQDSYSPTEAGLNYYWLENDPGYNWNAGGNIYYNAIRTAGDHLKGVVADGTRSTIFEGKGYWDNSGYPQVQTTPLTNPNVNNYDHTARLWTGYFTADTDIYSVQLYADDASSLWIDMNQDGVFQNDEMITYSLYSENRQTVTAQMTLTTGETYAVAVLFAELSGNEPYNLRVAPGATSSFEAKHYCPIKNPVKIAVWSYRLTRFL